jgi:hypothetical protein
MPAGRCRRRTWQERPCTLSDLNGSEDKRCGEAIASLTSVVTQLGTNIGARNISHYMALAMAADYIEGRFAEIGYSPVRQSYEARQKGFHNSLRSGSALSVQLRLLWLVRIMTATRIPRAPMTTAQPLRCSSS